MNTEKKSARVTLLIEKQTARYFESAIVSIKNVTKNE